MKEIKFTYRNHKGEVEARRIQPTKIEYITYPGYNYQPGWFLTGHDLDRPGGVSGFDNMRSFALTHIVFPDHLKLGGHYILAADWGKV